jgi:hypothetical protein
MSGLGKFIKGGPKILKKGAASVLVLTCIDPRFTDILSSFLYHQVWADYDLFALAGSSLGVVQGYSGNTNPYPTGASWPANTSTVNGSGTNGTRAGFPQDLNNANHWSGVFIDHLGLAKVLHDISEVWVFDHLDCGAYKALMLPPGSEDNTPGPHILNLTTFQTQLAQYATDAGITDILKFKGFLMRQNGTITLEVADSGGIEIGESHGYVDINAWTDRDYYLLIIYFLILCGIIYAVFYYKKSFR